jgi:hypothetical protein
MRKLKFRSGAVAALALAAGAALAPARADAQILVSNGSGTVAQYSLNGTLVNRALISGLVDMYGMAASGSNLFFTNGGAGTIEEYGMSGALVNGALVSGLDGPSGIAASGSNLYVQVGNGGVGAYTTSGATVNASLIQPLGAASIIATSGSEIFAMSDGHIGAYTTSGALLNADLNPESAIFPSGIAASESNVWVTMPGGAFPQDVVIDFTTSGALVTGNLVPGVLDPFGIAYWNSDLYIPTANDGGMVIECDLSGDILNEFTTTNSIGEAEYIVVVPEPATGGLILVGGLGLLMMRPGRRNPRMTR